MSTFHTNCGIPNSGVNFVTEPNIRGTLEILWSCLGTLILCTWTVQHLNVPLQTYPQTFREKLARYMSHLDTKVKWMTIALLAPEYILGKAVEDLISAQFSQHQFKEFAKATADNVPWSYSHTFLANMGGIVIRFDDVDTRGEADASEVHEMPLRDLEMVSGIEDSVNTAMEEPRPVFRPPTKSLISSDYAHDLERAHFSTEQAVLQNGRIAHSDLEPPPTVQLLLDRIKAHSNKFQDRYGFGMDGYARRTNTDSTTRGRSPWYPDKINVGLVESSLQKVHWKHFHEELKGGLLSPTAGAWCSNLWKLQGNCWALDAYQLLYARKVGIIKKLPSITEDEVSDHGKSDFFVKGLALVQVTWLIVQISVRAHAHLPVTLLEIATVAFSISTFLTYIFLWSKPQDVTIPFYIKGHRRPTMEEMIRLALRGPSAHLVIRPKVCLSESSAHGASSEAPGFIGLIHGAGITAVIFGCIHLIAWNFSYPTPVERLLWRIASIGMTGLPIAACLTMIGTHRLIRNIEMRNSNRKQILYCISALPLAILYILARLYILVEIFRSLFFLPPRAFLSTGTPRIPHIG